MVAGRIAAALGVDVTPQLERLSAPLLCLRAIRDRVIPARCTDEMRALKPSAVFVEIDAPHPLLQASPAEAWAHIEPFLDG